MLTDYMINSYKIGKCGECERETTLWKSTYFPDDVGICENCITNMYHGVFSEDGESSVEIQIMEEE